MSKHNYINPAFCQNSEFYPVPSSNEKNANAIYNRSLQIAFNSHTKQDDLRNGSLHFQRSMSTRSMPIKRPRMESTSGVHHPQHQQLQQPMYLLKQNEISNNLNEVFENRSYSGRYALVPVEELPNEQNNCYAIGPRPMLSTANHCAFAMPSESARRFAKSQDDLDRFSSQIHLQPEEPHSFHEDPSVEPYASLPSMLDQPQLLSKCKISLKNRQMPPSQNLQQQVKIKHAFSSDFGSKTFLIVDKNSNQRYQMVPTAEDEELVDDNQEIIQMHNGKAHRYAMIPTDDEEKYEQGQEEEETCLSNSDLNRSEKFLHRHCEQSSTSIRTSTPQKGAPITNVCSYPITPLKNPQATRMLHELLSTPPCKTPLKTINSSQQDTPRQMYVSQRELRMHHTQENESQPFEPPPILSRKNCQLSPQRLHYEPVKSKIPKQNDRTMAVIQPRLAGSRIHPHLDEEQAEDCNITQQKSPNANHQKIANATITLAIVSLMLVLGSSMNSALIVYMIAHMGKSFYLQFSLVAAISGVGLGYLGFRSRHCEWLPNRSYTSGYILVTVFCLLKCCGLLVILVLDPYPGLPLHDVTTGIILGLSTFTMFFIGLGVIGTLWCYRPPPDNRVDVM